MQFNSVQSSNPASNQRLASSADAAPEAKPASLWSRASMESSSAMGIAKSHHDLSVHKFDHLKLGKQFYEDLLVTIHDVPEKNVTLLQMNAGMGSLKWVLEDLSRLQNAGIPTASILQCGKRGDTECALVQKFAEVHDLSTSGPRTLVDSPLANQLTLDSLRAIRRGLEKHDLRMAAPLLGLEASGAVRVLWTGGMLEPDQGPSKEIQIRQLDTMISPMHTKLNGVQKQA